MALIETVIVKTLTGTAIEISTTRINAYKVTVQAFDSSVNAGNVFVQYSATANPTVTVDTCNYELGPLQAVTLEGTSNDSQHGQQVDLSKWYVNGTSSDKVRISYQITNYDA